VFPPHAAAPGLPGPPALAACALAEPPWGVLYSSKMRLLEGDNHLISERDGLVICQVWVRPDLSAEDGAKNAGQMVAYMTDAILRTGTPYRGIVFDVRRGPKIFGPQTRTVLEKLLALSAARKVRVAIIASDSATQVLQFRSLCAAAPTMNQVFADEPSAIRWLASGQPR
jgi:hypothetical protein